jgi:hypothetical protein
MEPQCLVDITIFINIKNHFNHFLNIFALIHYDVHFFMQIERNHTNKSHSKCNVRLIFHI